MGHVVRLEVLYFQLEYDTRCKADFLEVKDGPVSSAQPVGRFCGESVPSVFETLSNTMLITFRSDNSIQRSGFHLRYIFKGEVKFTDNHLIVFILVKNRKLYQISRKGKKLATCKSCP